MDELRLQELSSIKFDKRQVSKLNTNLTVGKWATDVFVSPLKQFAASIFFKLISLPHFMAARYCNYHPQLKEIKPCKGLFRARTWTISNTLYSDPLYWILPKWGNKCGHCGCIFIHALKHCANFHETCSHSISFCGHLLCQITSKSDKVLDFIYSLKQNIPFIASIFTKLMLAQQLFVSNCCTTFH